MSQTNQKNQKTDIHELLKDIDQQLLLKLLDSLLKEQEEKL